MVSLVFAEAYNVRKRFVAVLLDENRKLDPGRHLASAEFPVLNSKIVATVNPEGPGQMLLDVQVNNQTIVNVTLLVPGVREAVRNSDEIWATEPVVRKVFASATVFASTATPTTTAALFASTAIPTTTATTSRRAMRGARHSTEVESVEPLVDASDWHAASPAFVLALLSLAFLS